MSQAKNKGGLHVNTMTKAAKGTLLRQENVGSILTLDTAWHDDGPSVFGRWGERNPNAVKIARMYYPGNYSRDWKARCDRLLEFFAPHADFFNWVLTPWNEDRQNVHDPNGGIIAHRDETILAVPYLRENWPGHDPIKVAVGNFSVGNPPGSKEDLWRDWKAFLPALDVADGISIHEYGSPNFWSEPGDKHGVYKHDWIHPQRNWWVLRYRRFLDWMQSEYSSIKQLPILITECGRDQGLNTDSALGAMGWQAKTYESKSSGEMIPYFGGGNEDDYAGEIDWFLRQIHKDPLVICANLFACGTYSYENFGSFDVGGFRSIEAVLNYDYGEPLLSTKLPKTLFGWPVKPMPDAEAPPAGPPVLTVGPLILSLYDRWVQAKSKAGDISTSIGRMGFQAFVAHCLAVGVDGSVGDMLVASGSGFPMGTIEPATIPEPALLPYQGAEGPEGAILKLADQGRNVLEEIMIIAQGGMKAADLANASDRFIELAPAIDMRHQLPVRGVDRYISRSKEEMLDVSWLVLHHTNAGPARPTTIEVARYQTGGTPEVRFPEFAYHVYIMENGDIVLAHDLDRLVWSNGNGSVAWKQGVGMNNWRSIAVCFSGDNPTLEQRDSLSVARSVIHTVIGRSLWLRPHGDLDGTECPGVDVRRWVQSGSWE